MKGTHETKELIKPTLEQLCDPYVLQLIEALSVQQDTIEEYQSQEKERDESDHYGMYGPVCISTGQFDAGECYICYAKRKKQELKQCQEAFNNLEAASDAWEGTANQWKDKASEYQLVAGRYQYLHEQAQRAVNCIDDVFEYTYKDMTPDQLRVVVQTALAKYTAEVSKLITKNKK